MRSSSLILTISIALSGCAKSEPTAKPTDIAGRWYSSQVRDENDQLCGGVISFAGSTTGSYSIEISKTGCTAMSCRCDYSINGTTNAGSVTLSSCTSTGAGSCSFWDGYEASFTASVDSLDYSGASWSRAQ